MRFRPSVIYCINSLCPFFVFDFVFVFVSVCLVLLLVLVLVFGDNCCVYRFLLSVCKYKQSLQFYLALSRDL